MQSMDCKKGRNNPKQIQQLGKQRGGKSGAYGCVEEELLFVLEIIICLEIFFGGVVVER